MAKEERKKDVGVSKLDSLPITTVVGNDMSFKGDIHGDGIIRIDGKVEGNISSKQGIILGKKQMWKVLWKATMSLSSDTSKALSKAKNLF